jgi:hypothetical protein
MANINIALPEEVHKKIKYLALVSDKHIKEIIIQSLEKRTHGKH